jgi:hypothetical protein
MSVPVSSRIEACQKVKKPLCDTCPKIADVFPNLDVEGEEEGGGEVTESQKQTLFIKILKRDKMGMRQSR